MLLRIIRYIRGYVRICVIGYSPERFLNACSYKGIYIWGLKPVSGAYEMNLTVQGFRQLKPIIRKTGAKVMIIRRFGLPFLLHKYRKRKLFFLGAVICVFLILAMSRHIWSIDISGNQTYTDEMLIRFLKSRHVEGGMAKAEVDCVQIVRDIRKEYDGIIWVSASIQGTRLIIQIKENEDSIQQPEEKKTEGPTDLIADRDCIITRIVPRTGIVAVEVGKEVKKGELLVSGQIPVINDSGETVAYQYQQSDADIYGQTTLSYSRKLKLTYKEKIYESVQKHEYHVRIGSFFLRLGSVNNTYEKWELYGYDRELKIGENFSLPVSYGVRTARPYHTVTKKLSGSVCQERLSADFQNYCKELEKKGVEIIENDVKIYTESEYATAKGKLTVEMPIGDSVPSTLLDVPALEESQNEESKTGE
ncbi:sporulation protein YqfD [Faecalicatena contorta]|uniref:sporulation protein YqfD n=1 Tax=Faecalicatena contorta TaxID=39482 RepID=UPI001F3B0697|nr:sporulation protein YqfD [Faecalicatena contorta]MCF2682838.1 sporulation protein YqfD [Faecalicatena contorta]